MGNTHTVSAVGRPVPVKNDQTPPAARTEISCLAPSHSPSEFTLAGQCRLGCRSNLDFRTAAEPRTGAVAESLSRGLPAEPARRIQHARLGSNCQLSTALQI